MFLEGNVEWIFDRTRMPRIERILADFDERLCMDFFRANLFDFFLTSDFVFFI